MADEQTRSGRPDESASVSDSDFQIESASAKNAIEAPPEDTTQGRAPVAAAAEPVEEAVVEESTEQVEEPETPLEDASHTSASRVEKPKPAAAAAKPKNKVPLAKRTADLKHEVDVLTHTKHRTRGEVEAAERKLAELNRQIAENEAKLAGKPAPAATAKPGQPAADAEPAMPEFPDYRKFATDEEYEAAKAKYHTDLTAYNRAMAERIEKRITQGVEARFRGANDEAQITAAVDRLTTTRNKVAESKPDWEDRRANLAGVQSAWYDPDRHKADKTPFLTDLARTLLMQGNEEGGELLYWLGDPDQAERTQALADLLPSRPLRDAIVAAPSVIPLLDHFATEAGQVEFERLKQMHPVRVHQAIGALSVRLAGVSSGSPAPSHPITKAQPSARPPAGTPGARGTTGASASTGKTTFDDWMAAEDAKERSARERLAGIAR